MKDFFRSVKFKILLGFLAVLMGVMIYAASVEGPSVISSAFGVILSPIQKLSLNISNKVSSTLDMIFHASDYYDQNKDLQAQLDELRKQMVDYINTKDENEQLRQMLGLKENFPDIEISPPCTVIGKTTNDIFQSFFIDRGSYDGIEINDPVITPSGLIGIVTQVELTYSKVTTILSHDRSLGVYCPRTKDTGILEGDFEFASNETCKMIFIDIDSDIKKDDIITTSGHSGLVPKDLVVGTVEKIYIDDSGISKIAVIKPTTTPKNVTSVFVITSFDGQGSGYGE